MMVAAEVAVVVLEEAEVAVVEFHQNRIALALLQTSRRNQIEYYNPWHFQRSRWCLHIHNRSLRRYCNSSNTGRQCSEKMSKIHLHHRQKGRGQRNWLAYTG